MIIANPIYDVVFKRLMQDKRVAKFFIETLLEETIEEIEVKPQEYTFFKDLSDLENPDAIAAAESKIIERLTISVFRLDFIATIKTANNQYKKVLIEIQKAKNFIDIMRFRNYLAEQYKKEDEIQTEKGKHKVALPIVTIYMLGFQLPEIESPAIKASRQYIDLLTHQVIEKKSEFIEKLTHDCFIVQLSRIQVKIQTKLDKLLSVFEQNYFIDDKGIIKEYKHDIDDETIRSMLHILHYTGTDPKRKKEIEDEQEAYRVLDLATKELYEAIAGKDKTIEEKDKAIEEKDRAIEEKDKTIEEKDTRLKSCFEN